MTMSDFHKALQALRPGINFSNLDNTLVNVRWDDPLPEGFVPPTELQVAAMLAKLSVPPSIPNWKAHAILKVDNRHQDVLDVIAAIVDPVKRELVMTAFERLDPLPRHSATMVELLTVAGYDEAGIDDLFVRGNAIRIDAD